ncbi:MAG: PIN domain-containing protein [Polaromonas sp.]|uniref:PIN domain-containing protein n=1 Tax=Polaromonas sp. TaxID=1869339 RepID=UPI002731BCCC|nr:PIN domain-containing protein [Polaromonas sp.]MDP2450963.1 PIN domain-containing protein [Polaromonas sp.]MDP3248471.1 PIN domain-containing protein [Polaromonas sp.]MDP3757445.1 PIN domain-containing protein [Polaromonas sp.]
MFHVLIDTSVWLDLAENQRQTPLIDLIAELVNEKQITLLVPELVLSEFKANRDRVAARSARSLSTHFNLVKEAVRNAPAGAQKEQVLTYLSDLDHRIPIVGAAANDALNQIERMLNASTVLKTSDAAKLKAADRALQRRAPFHHEGKNGMADAMIIETYFEAVRSGKARERFAFVTHNKSDFSLAGGNQKLPHFDLAAGFSKIKSMYFITLADCIRKVDDIYLDPEFMKALGYEFEPRSLSEMVDAMDQLTEQVWYNRHKNLAWRIKHKKVKVVTQEEWVKAGSNNSTHIVDSVWDGAKRAAADTLKHLGKAKCGPHDDFEWGMINGKLSAIRWMLGDDWDMLDT